MKRWYLFIVVLVGVAVFGFAVHHVFAKRAQQRRETGYQAALRSYSEVLKPGMTRKDVEGYLKTKGLLFGQMCCMDFNRKSRSWDDLVKVGEEAPPWYCSRLNIYVGFQFNPYEQPADGFEEAADERDTLEKVQIFRWLEGCL